MKFIKIMGMNNQLHIVRSSLIRRFYTFKYGEKLIQKQPKAADIQTAIVIAEDSLSNTYNESNFVLDTKILYSIESIDKLFEKLKDK